MSNLRGNNKIKNPASIVIFDDPKKEHLEVLKKIVQTYEIPFSDTWTPEMSEKKIKGLYAKKRLLELNNPELNI